MARHVAGNDVKMEPGDSSGEVEPGESDALQSKFNKETCYCVKDTTLLCVKLLRFPSSRYI